jgi:hypothetical protein
MSPTPTRHKPRISATVDLTLLRAVDEWVDGHPGSHRVEAIEEALRLWYAHVQDAAMVEQYNAPDDVDPDEWAAWQTIRKASAERTLFRSNE